MTTLPSKPRSLAFALAAMAGMLLLAGGEARACERPSDCCKPTVAKPCCCPGPSEPSPTAALAGPTCGCELSEAPAPAPTPKRTAPGDGPELGRLPRSFAAPFDASRAIGSGVHDPAGDGVPAFAHELRTTRLRF